MKYLLTSMLLVGAFTLVGCTSSSTTTNTNTQKNTNTTTQNTNNKNSNAVTDEEEDAMEETEAEQNSVEEAVEESVTAELGEEIDLEDSTLTVTEVVQDSRCPEDTQCVQAGNVTVAVELVDASEQTSTVELTLPATQDDETDSAELGDYMVTLVEVTPEPKSGETIADEDYKFELEVK